MKIAVFGAGGYVGSLLTLELLQQGHEINAFDLYLYGEPQDLFGKWFPNLTVIKGDIREKEAVYRGLLGCEAVVMLAAISNDPSFDLSPELSKSINLDSFDLFLDCLDESNIKKLIFASSSSVYGVSELPNVTEDSEKKPLTLYAQYKLDCEKKLKNWKNKNNIIWTIVRPATLCGWSQRLRLDLTVNILACSGLFNKKIKVFGGTQHRCSLHVKDMCRAYMHLLKTDPELINHEIFNIGNENCTVMEIAEKVKKALGDPDLPIEVIPSDDNRSYRINSDKIKNKIGFTPEHSIEDAIQDLQKAFLAGKIKSLDYIMYHNVKRMKEINLK